MKPLVINLIKKEFPNIGALKETDLLGDNHLFGAVSRLKFECGTTLIYKPRNSVGEKILYEIENEVFSILKIENKNPIIFISTEDFSIFEDITNDDKFIINSNFYFYSLGIKSAILYCLGASDISYENVVLRKSTPVIIDAETLFSPDNIFNYKIKWSFSLSYFSLSRIGIFPSNYIFSCIYTNKQKEMLKQKDLQLFNKIKVFPATTNKLNKLLKKGFDASITTLNKLYSEGIIQKIILSNARDLSKLRVILKPTYAYFDYMNGLPSNYTFDRYEIRQLQDGIIPRFTFSHLKPNLTSQKAIEIFGMLLTFSILNKKFLNSEILKLCND